MRVLVLLALAGCCATVPASPRYTEEQVRELEACRAHRDYNINPGR